MLDAIGACVVMVLLLIWSSGTGVFSVVAALCWLAAAVTYAVCAILGLPLPEGSTIGRIFLPIATSPHALRTGGAMQAHAADAVGPATGAGAADPPAENAGTSARRVVHAAEDDAEQAEEVKTWRGRNLSEGHAP